MELCVGTGQRIGDVLEMRWSDIQDGAVCVRQNKTNKELWVPILPELQAALDYDIHSWRYNAACELLEAGCGDDLIAAVTGQSPAMVSHYTKQVRQKIRAKEAQQKGTEQKRNV